MESMMKNKHAYLIIAHNKFEQLAFLVSLLDYKHHDIYILVDKKSDFSAEVKNKITHAQSNQSQKVGPTARHVPSKSLTRAN